MYRDNASINDAYNAGKNVLAFAGDLTKEDLEKSLWNVIRIVPIY